MMVEVSEDLGCKPDVVILSVGGGGLMSGALRGMEKVGWQDVPLVAMETIGADCFNKSVKANKMVAIPDITRYSKSNFLCRDFCANEASSVCVS